MAQKLGATTDYLLGLSDEPPPSATPSIKTGDIKGNSAPVVLGSHNTVVPPPSSSSSSTTKKKGKRK